MKTSTLTLTLALVLCGCPEKERRPPPTVLPEPTPVVTMAQELGPIVDIHCHVFNARDLPMEQWLIAHGAPPRFAEFVRLLVDALSEDDPLILRALPQDLRAVFEQARGLVRRPEAPTQAELVALEGLFRLIEAGPLKDELDQLAAGPRPEGTLGDWAGQARDALRWALVLSRRRETLAEQLLRTYPDTVLFTPLVVDMNHWFGERREAVPTSYAEQMTTMRNLIAVHRGRMLPFFAFDPERERLRRQSSPRPLKELLQELAEDGFVGVKLYPPFGFRPTQNAAIAPDHACAVEVPPEVRAAYDPLLEELFAVCEELDLCVAAHCEDPGAGLARCAEHADPKWWAEVLARHPALRLNLMHFGGAEGLVANPPTSWARRVAELMHRHSRVYADFGAHAVPTDAKLREAFFSRLDELERELPGVRARLMFGTDWHLLVRHREHELFARRYLKAWRDRWGVEAGRRFAGAAALEYLGIPSGRNGQRVRALFARNGWPVPDWLE